MNFTLEGRILKYVNEDCILIKQINGNWKELSIQIHIQGYYQIIISKKKYYLHRIIGYLFLGLDIDNPEQYIDHIDGNVINNYLENLRIVTSHENDFNRTKAKGYCFDKQYNKFKSNIKFNGKTIHLGHFDTKEEARKAYVDAKKIYHIISEK